MANIPKSSFVCYKSSDWSVDNTWGFGFDEKPWKSLLQILNCRFLSPEDLADWLVILLGLQDCITRVSRNQNNYWRYSQLILCGATGKLLTCESLKRHYEGHWAELEERHLAKNARAPPRWPQKITEGQQTIKWQDEYYGPDNWVVTGAKKNNASNETRNLPQLQNRCTIQ